MQRIYIRLYSSDTTTPDLYTDLSEALNHHGPATLQYFDMEDDEAFYHISRYSFGYQVNKKSGNIEDFNCGKSVGFNFVWYKTTDIDKFSKKELKKKVEVFKKRLHKFDELDYAKHKLEIKIQSLQNELDILKGKN